MKNYFRVRLSHVPSSLEESISQLAFQFGSSGVTESLNYVQPNLAYDPEIIPQKLKELDAYFDSHPAKEFVDQVKELSHLVQVSIFEEETKDWLEEWKKGFNPFQLAGPFWIIPSWIPAPPEAEISILIDPGMAFGTGTHATTQMASYFVYKLLYKNPDIKNLSVLDVGTGTAVLAIQAAKSGAEYVTGIEIDPEARRVARENVVRNEVQNMVSITDELIEDVKDQFDVVVANIIDGVLISIRKDLVSRVKPGGSLFVTGILTERDEIFNQEFIEKSPVKIHRRLEKDEWVGYWLKVQQ